MNTNRRWLGWLAVGLGTLALVVALFGRGFGPMAMANGWGNPGVPQAYAQQGAGRNGRAGAPGANAQPNAGPQAAPGSPNANGQQAGPGAPFAGSQRGQGGPAGGRAENGRPGRPGFERGGWFGLPFRFGGGLFKIGMLALAVVAGLWLIRGRGARAVPASAPAAPAPEASESEGESYTDEPRDLE